MACRGVDAEKPDFIARRHRVHRLRASGDQIVHQKQCGLSRHRSGNTSSSPHLCANDLISVADMTVCGAHV